MDLSAIAARYSKTESSVDAFGRSIVVGKLKPSQQMKAAEMAVGDGTTGVIRLVCSVREVDGNQYTFPKTRAEVESRIDMLDNEGLEAAGTALAKLYEDEVAPKDEAAAVKN